MTRTMLRTSRVLFLTLATILIVTLYSTVFSAENSIVDIAVADGRFTTLVTAVQAAELDEMLDSNGPFTVFAPTDAAFDALPAGALDGLLADKVALRQTLLYHIVQGAVDSGTVVTLSSATTALGKDISIKVQDGSVILNDSVKVIITDIEASNGIIHVIDAVLLPPSSGDFAIGSGGTDTGNSIVDVASADGRFTTLLAAAGAANLATMLDQNGPFTVFAPTDAAFDALPAGALDGLLADPTALRQVLLFHIARGALPASEVVNMSAIHTALGQEASVEVVDGSVIVNGNAKVIITDIQASNGIIHVLDAVMLPPSAAASPAPSTPAPAPEADLPNIAEIAIADGRFTTLVTALDAAGLVGMVSNNGPFTVFAPTDDAFAALPAGTVESLLEDTNTLRQILLYHIVPGEVSAADVVQLTSAMTALGQTISIEVVDGSVILNGNAKVIITDIEASNGIIHVIDMVLIP